MATERVQGKGRARNAKHETTVHGALVPSAAQKRSLAAAMSRHKQLNTLESCLELGEVVLKRFYGGSLHTLRRLGSAHVSFRRMAEDPEVPVDGLALYRALMTYETYHRHRGWRFKQLGKSHYRAVFGLAPTLQERLLKRADREQWTVNQLNHEATLARARLHGGAPPRPAFEKLLRGVRQFADPDFDGYSDLDRVDELSDAERKRLAQIARDLSKRFGEIATALKRRR